MQISDVSAAGSLKLTTCPAFEFAVWILVFLVGSLAAGERLPAADSSQSTAVPFLEKTNGVYQIDLPAALQLAGAQNLDIQIAREKLAEARANNQSATWQFFPWIGPGVTWRRHDNLIQDVGGNVIDVHKQSYTVGPTV